MTGIQSLAVMGLFLYSNLVGAAVPDTATVRKVEPLATHTVAMTGYNALPEQTDSDPFTTASGAYSNPEVIAARSVDLADELPFGTVIEIVTTGSTSTPSCGLSAVEEQVGLRVIADSMHSRKRNQIDLLFDHENTVKLGKKTLNPAVVMGICKNIEIRVVGKIAIKEIPKTQAQLKKVVDEQLLAIKKF